MWTAVAHVASLGPEHVPLEADDVCVAGVLLRGELRQRRDHSSCAPGNHGVPPRADPASQDADRRRCGAAGPSKETEAAGQVGPVPRLHLQHREQDECQLQDESRDLCVVRWGSLRLHRVHSDGGKSLVLVEQCGVIS